MTDIYVYAGEPSPNDVKLSDPTVLRAGSVTVTPSAAEATADAGANVVVADSSTATQGGGGGERSRWRAARRGWNPPIEPVPLHSPPPDVVVRARGAEAKASGSPVLLHIVVAPLEPTLPASAPAKVPPREVPLAPTELVHVARWELRGEIVDEPADEEDELLLLLFAAVA